MRRIRLVLLLASGLACVTTPLSAQGDHASDPSLAPDLSRVRAAAAQMRVDAMQRGDFVAGWKQSGADPIADIRELGAESHYLFSRTPDEDSVAIVTDRAVVDFAPDDWEVIDSYGLHDPSRTGAVIEFTPLSHRFVMGSRAIPRRVGDVDCWDNLDHALLFHRPGAVTSDADADAWETFRIIILALEDQAVCVRYEGRRDEAYTSQTFAPDGHRLPSLDIAGEEAWIVEARPIDQYVAYRALDGFDAPSGD